MQQQDIIELNYYDRLHATSGGEKNWKGGPFLSSLIGKCCETCGFTTVKFNVPECIYLRSPFFRTTVLVDRVIGIIAELPATLVDRLISASRQGEWNVPCIVMDFTSSVLELLMAGVGCR